MNTARAASLHDQEARTEIAEALDRTLFVEAGAGSGKTTALVDRVAALVESGVSVEAIAAITFTEKAAAELRDRIRTVLAKRRDTASDDARARWQTALADLDVAPIGTLHAFAQRLLREHPVEAALPPRLEVMDEVASQIAFDRRWRAFLDALLQDPTVATALEVVLAAGVRLGDLRELALAFGDNWDLLEDAIPWDASAPTGDVDARPVLEEIERLLEFAAEHCTDASDKLYAKFQELRPLGQQIMGCGDDAVDLVNVLDNVDLPVGNVGSRKAWDVDTTETRHRLMTLRDQLIPATLRSIAEDALHRIAAAVRDMTLQAAHERQVAGHLEFHDLLVLARDLLTGPHATEVRRALRQRYRRLLLDEFQDTDPIQIDIAVRIASDPDLSATPIDPRSWRSLPTDDGWLFFVGDPKQSIYRFRRADIALYLDAADRFSDGRIELTTNFRSSPALLDWLNGVFDQLIQHESGSQPAYVSLRPAPGRTDPATGPAVGIIGAHPHEDDPRADPLRHREARDVADTILLALEEGWTVTDVASSGHEHWRACRPSDIAVLLPARTSLAALEAALEQREIPYRAETSSLVYATREVRDLLLTLRAVADPSDRLSLVSALCSPVFGCGHDDLVTHRFQWGGDLDLLAPLPEEQPEDHPVRAALQWLRDLHAPQVWDTPSELLDRIVRERRLLEIAWAERRPRESWRRIRFVLDQARHWSELTGGTLREYLTWAAMQASDSTRVVETVLPETDDDSVRILTIHGAKGLEFPITVLSGMTTRPNPRRGTVEVLWSNEPGEPAGLRIGSRIRTDRFEALAPIDEQMGHHERLRLLYVAATRARDHLVVSLHRCATPSSRDRPRLTSAELLAEATHDLDRLQIQLASAPGAFVGAGHGTPPCIDTDGLAADSDAEAVAAWDTRRRRAISQAGQQRTISATTLVELLGADPADDDGWAKDPRDLDLPPWLKGRYGSALGRAVHGVLQTIDLDSGAGLRSAVAAQATAEGIPEAAESIERRVRGALGSEPVRRAARRPHWREIYLGTEISGRALEGYVDLLYRDDDGLVIVDYKTADTEDDLDQRVRRYTPQGAAYALAAQTATGDAVARVLFVFLLEDRAIVRALDDLDGARARLLDVLAGPVEASPVG